MDRHCLLSLSGVLYLDGPDLLPARIAGSHGKMPGFEPRSGCGCNLSGFGCTLSGFFDLLLRSFPFVAFEVGILLSHLLLHLLPFVALEISGGFVQLALGLLPRVGPEKGLRSVSFLGSHHDHAVVALLLVYFGQRTFLYRNGFDRLGRQMIDVVDLHAVDQIERLARRPGTAFPADAERCCGPTRAPRCGRGLFAGLLQRNEDHPVAALFAVERYGFGVFAHLDGRYLRRIDVVYRSGLLAIDHVERHRLRRLPGSISVTDDDDLIAMNIDRIRTTGALLLERNDDQSVASFFAVGFRFGGTRLVDIDRRDPVHRHLIHRSHFAPVDQIERTLFFRIFRSGNDGRNGFFVNFVVGHDINGFGEGSESHGRERQNEERLGPCPP